MSDEMLRCPEDGRKREYAFDLAIAGLISLGVCAAIIVFAMIFDITIDGPTILGRVVSSTFLASIATWIGAVVCGLQEGALKKKGGKARQGLVIGCLGIVIIFLLMALSLWLVVHNIQNRVKCKCNLREISLALQKHLQNCGTGTPPREVHMTNLVPRYLGTLPHCPTAKDNGQPS